MNQPPGDDNAAFAQALSLLASHADGHAPVNRLAAVERVAHRRAVVRHSGFALSAAAVVAVAAGVATSGTAWFHAGHGSVVAVITTAQSLRPAAEGTGDGDPGAAATRGSGQPALGTVGLGAEPSSDPGPTLLTGPGVGPGASSAATTSAQPAAATPATGSVSAPATAIGTSVYTASPSVAASSTSAPTPAAPSPAQPSLPGAAPLSTVPVTAYLNVTLRKTSADGVRAVAVVADLSGAVPQNVDAGSGAWVPATQIEPLFTKITFGDGASDGSDGGDAACRAGAPLVPLTQSYPHKHTYAKAGTYTITFSTAACAPVGTVTRTLVVSVS